eukprot:scaffold13928_cov29-Tisochrysis_lutea.AAC.2
MRPVPLGAHIQGLRLHSGDFLAAAMLSLQIQLVLYISTEECSTAAWAPPYRAPDSPVTTT